VRKDFGAAARVLRDNCEAHGHSESCYKLGAYQAIGKGGPGAGSPTPPGLPAWPPLPPSGGGTGRRMGRPAWGGSCQRRELLCGGHRSREGG